MGIDVMGELWLVVDGVDVVMWLWVGIIILGNGYNKTFWCNVYIVVSLLNHFKKFI